MTRLLFHPGNYLQLTTSGFPFNLTFGTPLPVASDQVTLTDPYNVSRTTKNNGNIIHTEALARMLACHPTRSASCRLNSIYRYFNGDTASIQAFLKENFDAIVVSFANIVRSLQPPALPTDGQVAVYSEIAAVLRISPIPVYVFGIGIQEVNADSVFPSHLLEMLGAINERAEIFGVRGRKTEQVLHQLGFSRARALGCPSFYVYPRNVIKAAKKSIPASPRIMSAGYLNNRNYTADLINTFPRQQPAYVFQNDLVLILQQPTAETGFYDDATGECDKATIEALMQSRYKLTANFSSYRYFRTTYAWRSFASMQDVFLGARLHGGVCALQAGTPAILLTRDDRVQELAAFFDLPSLALNKAATLGAERILHEIGNSEGFNRFHRTYRERLEAFYAHCEEKGLSFSTKADGTAALDEPLQTPAPPVSSIRKWWLGRRAARG